MSEALYWLPGFVVISRHNKTVYFKDLAVMPLKSIVLLMSSKGLYRYMEAESTAAPDSPLLDTQWRVEARNCFGNVW